MKEESIGYNWKTCSNLPNSVSSAGDSSLPFSNKFVAPSFCLSSCSLPTPDVNYSKWKVQYGSKFFRYLVKPNRLNSNCFFFQSISSANPKSTFEKTLCLLPHKIATAKQHSCNTSKIAHFIYYLLPTNVRRRLEIAFTKTCCGQLRLSGHMGSN